MLGPSAVAMEAEIELGRSALRNIVAAEERLQGIYQVPSFITPPQRHLSSMGIVFTN